MNRLDKLIKLKLLPVRLDRRITTARLDLLNWKFILLISVRAACFAYFIYFLIVEYPTPAWTTHTILTFIYMIFGIAAPSIFPFQMAAAFIKYSPYSHAIDINLTSFQFFGILCLVALFTLGADLVVLPMLIASTSTIITSKTVAVCVAIGISNCMGFVEQSVCLSIVGSWTNDMIEHCNKVLNMTRPKINDLQGVLGRYEAFKAAIDNFVFVLFSCVQVVTIIAFSVGTKGKKIFENIA